MLYTLTHTIFFQLGHPGTLVFCLFVFNAAVEKKLRAKKSVIQMYLKTYSKEIIALSLSHLDCGESMGYLLTPWLLHALYVP